MDNTKLNELAARAMGWKLFSPPHLNYAKIWATKDGIIQCPVGEWNPAGCADDALVLLTKAAGTQRYELCNVGESMAGQDGKCRWYCVINIGRTAFAETAALAMTLCALRASPEVTEEQIQEALCASK